MRINNNRPVDRAAGPRRIAGPAGSSASAETDAPAPLRSVTDVATFLGIPEGDLTAKVREGLAQLIAEVDRLRRELVQKERRLRYLEILADEDPLTPVVNRRAFVRELSREMAYAERYGVPSSVLFFDVNGMKQINDNFGHSAGDAALNHVANLLLDNLRSSDVVARLGGDEFGVLLSRTDQTLADSKAAELARLIDQTPFTWKNETLSVGVAVGAFAFSGGVEAQDILDSADRAMYQRKQAMSGGGPG